MEKKTLFPIFQLNKSLISFSAPKYTIHHVIFILAATILLRSNVVHGRHSHRQRHDFDYCAISCRSHSASLTDFGGVGDGTTSNTKAFQTAIDNLSQFESDGGSMLFVPPGKWLTGSFNLTSHFTLYLHQDAVLLASQVGQ